MSQLLTSLLGMGSSGGFGASGGASSSSTDTKGTGSQTTATQYAPGQMSLQDLLMKAFAAMVPGMATGTLSPNVQATETAGADQINKSYSTVGDRANRFLAARGFGKSGQVGKAALDTEVGRQGALAQNYTSAAGLQLNQNSAYLSDALAAAFASMGSKVDYTKTDTSDTSGSGFGLGVGLGASGMPMPKG